MPHADAHLAKVQRDLATARVLFNAGDEHLAWCATTLFYVAVHIVEATFFHDASLAKCDRHFSSHSNRSNFLRSTRSYQNVWLNFRPLKEISEVARYMDGGQCDFGAYMTRTDIEKTILKHHLKKVGDSCDKRVNKKLFSGSWDPHSLVARP